MSKRFFSNIIGAKVVREEDGFLFARVIDVIVNPENGKIEALWVKMSEFLGPRKILLTQDIYEWKIKIYIHNEDSFTEPEEVIRIQRILHENISIYKQKVKTVNEEYLGKVYDYDFDLETFHLLNLYVIRGFFLSYQKRIIPKKEIIKITDKAIIVKNDLKAVKWKREKIIDLKEFVLPDQDPNPVMGCKNKK